MAKGLKLYEVHSFSTSPNSRQCTTLLNAHALNCSETRCIARKLSDKTDGIKTIITSYNVQPDCE